MKATTTFTAAAVLAAAAAVPALAHAQDGGYDGGYMGWNRTGNMSNGPYVSVRGGWSVQDDQDYNTGAGRTHTELNNGYLASAALGTRRGPWRAEIEGIHQHNDVDSHIVAGATLPGSDGDMHVDAAMANIYRDVGHIGPLHPYIGGGVGYARVSLNNYRGAGATFLDDNDGVFAYQGMAGVSYDINPCWSANVEYRYLGGNDAHVTTSGGTNTKVNYSSNNVVAGLTYKF